MNSLAILDLWRSALETIVVVGGPFVVAALAVGLLTALIQAATQLQENVLSFAPKLVATGLVLFFAGHWSLDRLVSFTQQAAEAIVRIGAGGGGGR